MVQEARHASDSFSFFAASSPHFAPSRSLPFSGRPSKPVATDTISDTIAAISTAIGAAARMVVRMSGGRAVEIARGICPALPAAPSAAVREMTFAGLSFPALVYCFRAPRSSTGEDLVEFHIPGNPVIARILLDHLTAHSARPAEPGEFTARAYFNGRLDLAEAEGVAATIGASNAEELAAARRLLSGELARRLRPVMDLVADTLALTEVAIDFVDEDVTFLSEANFAARIASADAALGELLSHSARFERLAHEPAVVLVGLPNAGKSTLLNALAGRQRAVVSPVAGTTRDALSAEVSLPRGIIRVIDVAGMDEQLEAAAAPSAPQAQIDAQMQIRARHAIETADLIVHVQDLSNPAAAGKLPQKPDLTVGTKLDLVPSQSLQHAGMDIAVSAVTGQNIPDLRDRLDTLAFGSPAPASAFALNARHVRCIEEAREALARAASQVNAGNELVALDLRAALDALGRIRGVITPDDLLGRIFSSFCIGK